VYPLATEALFQKKITVGEPYFNQMALPLGLVMLFLMGVGPMLPWGSADRSVLRTQALIPALAGLATAGICAALGYRGFMPLTAFGLAGFTVVSTLRELLLPARQRMTEQKEDAMTAFFRSATRARRRFGGYVVHLGIVAIVVAVAASSAYKIHTTGTLKAGQTLGLGDFQVRFDGLSEGREPRRSWVGANITILGANGLSVARHDADAPRLNYYERQNDPVGSPMVHEMVVRDLYVSLLAYDAKTGTATFNAWVFPLVGWIWYAIPILVLGTLISLWPQRKQKASLSESAGDALPQGS
jgi:cytochrome c-type biogenesis protein CcmF